MAGRAAPAGRPADGEAMVVTSTDYLAGHLLRKAMLIFEDSMGPWVKREARAHLSDKLGVDPDDDERRCTDEHAAALAERRAEHTRLLAELDEALAAAPGAASAERDKAAVKKLKKRLAALDSSNDPPSPVPRWVSECPSGHKTAKFLRHDTRWDVHTIVSVMQGLMKGVFAQHLPDHFHAKHLLSGIVKVLSLRADRAHGASLAEPDVLEALQRMREVMELCGRDAKCVDALDLLLTEAHKIVDQARKVGSDGSGEGATCPGPTLTADEANAQRLFEALSSWALHVEVTMGLVVAKDDGATFERVPDKGQLEFSNGTVVFGPGFNANNKQWSGVVMALGEQFKAVAFARHWYFHHLVDQHCDIGGAFRAMPAVVDALVDINKAAEQWRPPLVADRDTPMSLVLKVPSARMKPPVRRVKGVVGRDATVADVTAVLASSGARVLIHGLPGVGKDTVMAEVANRDEVRSMVGLQAWVQASSDALLRRQLIDMFKTHRPRVVKGHEDDADAAIQAIQRWLATHDDWVLFVEDASVASTTLWEVLPGGGGEGAGRVLVTSQVDLSKQHGMFANSRFELAPITTAESVELLRLKNALKGKVPAAQPSAVGDQVDDEAALRERCVAAGAGHVYESPADGESGREKKQRRDVITATLVPYEEAALRRRCVHDTVWCYVPPPKGEAGPERRRRHKHIEQSLFEHGELTRPGLRDFLETTLGNLPLSVELFANMMRRDGESSVLGLIERFKRTGSDIVDVSDRDGRDIEDTHHYGLSLSVRICLDRLRESQSVSEEDRANAIALLSLLSLLDRAQTPVSLLSGRGAAEVARAPGACHSSSCRTGANVFRCASSSCVRRRRLAAVLGDAAALQRARRLSVEHGLLQEPGEGEDGTVGVMHQLVQRCLLRELVALPTAGSDAVSVVRRLLTECFDFNESTPVSRWAELRRIVPCVEAWGKHVIGDFGFADNDADVSEPPSGMMLTEGDLALFTRLGLLLDGANGDAGAAAGVFTVVLAQSKRVLPPDCPQIATSMNNLAASFSALGRHEDALKIQKEALDFCKRVLPPDDPRIATSVNDLAVTFSALGQHEDALKMKIGSLELCKRVMSPDHPDIATSMNNIAASYSALGRHEDAFRMHNNALDFRKRVLPPDHPDIASSMSNLAASYSALGRHEEALKLQKEALDIRKRILPPDHPDIALSMNNLAVTCGALGRHEDALKMKKETLAFRKRVLPPDHPDVASSMNNLAASYFALGRHEDALKMQKEVLDFCKRVLPSDHPQIALSMNNLAASHSALGRHEDALKMKKEALEFRKRVLPPDHPDIASSMGNLAETYSALGRHEDALKMKKETLAFRKRVLPPDHPDNALSMGNLAETYSALGRHEEALNMKKEALDFHKQILPPDHPDIASSMNNLAATYSALGRHEDALKMQKEVLGFCKRVMPPDHPAIASSMGNLAETYGALGQHEDALKMQKEALDIRKRMLPPDPQIMVAMNKFALTCGALGQHEDARNMLEELLDFCKRVLPPDHPVIASSMNNLAASYSALGRHVEALLMEKEALNLYKRVLPPDDPQIATSMSNLAVSLSALGQHKDALKIQKEALDFCKRVLPPDHPDIAASMNNLAFTFSELGWHEDAFRMRKEALDLCKRVLPPDHPEISASIHNLAVTHSALRRHEGALRMKKETAALRRRALTAAIAVLALDRAAVRPAWSWVCSSVVVPWLYGASLGAVGAVFGK